MLRHTLIRSILLATSAVFVGTCAAHANCQMFEHEKFGGDSEFVFAATQKSRFKNLELEVSSLKITNGCTFQPFFDRDFQRQVEDYPEGNWPQLKADHNDWFQSAECNC